MALLLSIGGGVAYTLTDWWPASAAPGDLTVEIKAGYNLVVDSNVQSPSTFGPSAATVSARVCNVSGNTINNASVYIGDFAAQTPGIYPSRSVGVGTFNTDHPALVDGGGSYAFTHEGGRLGTSDATRQLGDLAAGQCVEQYWTFSYPRCENVGGVAQEPPCTNDPVWGNSVKPEDDLYLDFDVWTTGIDNTATTVTADETWTMHLRNEISAMANKIEPNGNPGGTWFNTNIGTVQVGGVITSNGILYRIGNVRFGFDNDKDYLPDYNFWLQPIGDASQFDGGCFRLIRTSGVITVAGGTPKTINFTDQLYFTYPEVPTDNTNITGEVFYTFLALGTQCLAAPTPYQEAASGYDNEKFNGDFGAGGPVPIDSGEAVIGLDKSGDPNAVVLGNVINYTIPFINNGDKSAGLLLTSGDFVNSPLVISDSIPAGAQYQTGTATYTLSAPKNGIKILYSADNTQTWSETEPVPATSVTHIQWWLQDPLDSKDSGAAKFAILIPSAYTGTPVIENCADAQFGNGPSIIQACDTTQALGTHTIGNEVWQDNDSDGLKDAGEPYLDGVTVWLYYDKTGDGQLGSDDPLLLTTTTGITTSGFYTFSNLLNGNYLVVVDKADSDIPAGYTPTTADIFAVTLNDNDYLTADFGFGPALSVSKTLLSGAAYEGREVTYKIEVTNLRPGDGTGQTIACQSTAWADKVNLSTDTPASGTGNQAWGTPENALGSPNTQYALSAMGNNDDDLALGDFNTTSTPGNITSVEMVIYAKETVELNAGDRLEATIYNSNTPFAGPPQFIFTGLNTFTQPVNSLYEIHEDITSLKTWSWSDFIGGVTEVLLIAGKAGGTPGDLGIDAVSFVITTDETCGGGLSDTLNPVPLSDTFDATLLQFVSADPSQNSVSSGGATPYANTGTINWNNIGPLYAGQTKEITVTFKGLDPGATAQTITNTATVTNAYFATGEPANGGQDDAVTTITQTGLISGVVWSDIAPTGWQPNTASLPGYDAGDSFIPGVTVTLFACAQNQTGEPIIPLDPAGVNTGRGCSGGGSNGGYWREVDSRQTDQNGDYLFDGLLDGYYYILVDNASLPGGSGTLTAKRNDINTAGLNTTGSDQWGGNNTTTEDLDPASFYDPINSAEDITNINFGYTVSPMLFGRVWADYNGDGVIDPNEPYLSNVTVQLDGSATTTTDANGYYSFSTTAADHTITVNTGTLPTGTGWTNTFDPNSTTSPPANSDSGTITVTTGEMSGSHNFGYRGSSSIGDTVFYDYNGDGSQGAAEGGIENVVVYLYNDVNGDGIVNGADAIVLTDTTDASGNYLFENLPPGNWVVVVDNSTLAGTIQTADKDGTMDDKTAVTTDGSDVILNADFGYQPYGTGSIGDTVWRDMNGNALQGGSTETGIPNITVTLYLDTGDGVFNPAADPEIGALSTGSDGKYLFENLISGTYFVDVLETDPDLPTDAYGKGYVLSTNNDGMTVTLTTGQTYLNADFGFAPPGALGNLIYQDNNNNGQYDLGEAGIPNVTVWLYEAGGSTPVATTTTNAAGEYTFTGLMPFTYTVVVDTASLPSGYSQTGDPDYPANNSGTIYEMCTADSGNVFGGCDSKNTGYLRLGQIDFSRDFGYLPPRSIGDLVWLDANGNGLQDAGERGLGGITVTVTLPSGGGTFTTTTDNQGYYGFGSDVLGNSSPDGNFTIVIDPGSTYTHTYDYDGGTTSPDGQVILNITGSPYFTDTIDFGLRLNGPRTLTGTVFFDQGGLTDTLTDTFTAGDLPYLGITVILYDSVGALLGNTTTDAGGHYTFTNLFNNSDYTVVVQKDSTLQAQTLTARPDNTASSIFSTAADSTYTSRVNVAIGASDVGDIDFGYFSNRPILSLTKTVDPAGSVAPGDTLTYTLTVSNTGTLSATGVIITDTLPVSTTFIAATLPHTGPVGGVITWSIGAVATQTNQVVTMTVQVSNTVPAGAIITNTAWLTSAEGLTATATVTSPIVVNTPTADLLLAKYSQPDPVAAGQVLTYTLTYTNAGPSAAADVYITDTLPLSVTFGGVVSAPLNWSNPVTVDAGPPATLTWFTPTLAYSATGELVYTVTVDSAAAGVITNTAAITTSTPDSDPANNPATEPTTVIVPGLTLDPDHSATLLPGQIITYSHVLTNSGSVTDTFALTYTTTGLFTVTHNLPPTITLGSGLTATFVITVQVPLNASPPAQEVTVITATSGLDPARQDSDTDTTAVSGPGLTLDPDHNTTLLPGQTITYTHVLTNEGNATDVFTLTVVSVGPFTATHNLPPTVTLGAGLTATFVITVQTPLTASPPAQEVTVITATSGLDPTRQDSDTDTTGVVAIDLALAKSASPTTVSLGDEVVFTVVISNTGPDTATGVTVADELPTGLTFVGSSATAGSYSSISERWSGLTLTAGEVQTLTLTATVVSSGTITNIAQVTAADQPDSDSTPNNDDGNQSEDDEDSATLTGINPVIGLAKAVGTPVNHGDGAFEVPYTLVVKNLGNVVLSSVQLTDDLSITFAGATGFSVTAGPNATTPLNGNSGYNGTGDLNLLTGIDSLGVGQVATVTLTVLVTPGGNLGPYNNSAFVSGTSPLSDTVTDSSDNGTNPDPDGNGTPGDPNEDDPTPVNFPATPAIAISKTRLTASPVSAGSPVQFRIVVTNTGNITLATVPLTDSYQTAYLSFTGATPAPDDGSDDGTLNWSNLGPLAVNETAVVTVSFTANASTQLLAGAVTTNTATVSAIDTDGTPVPPGSNADTVEILQPAVTVSKLISLGTVAPQQMVTYTILITNTGEVSLNTINVTDTLDSGLIYTSGTASPPEDSRNGQELTWLDVTTGAPLAPNSVFTITLTAQVTTTIGTYGNYVVVEAPLPTGVITADDEVHVIVADPAIALSKEVAAPYMVENGLITFTIRLTNTGPSTLKQVPLIDHFTGPVEYVGGTPPADITDNVNQVLAWNDLTETFGDMAPGDTFVVTTVFHVTTAGTNFSMTNVASVTGAIDVFDNSANEAADSEVLNNQPTAIDLLRFTAGNVVGGIQLDWATAVEIDNFGFLVKRSATGRYEDAESLGLVPGQGKGTAAGGVYSFLDKAVQTDTAYTYWLVDVDLSGIETVHPTSVTTIAKEVTIGPIYLPIITK
jgi:uncharacterized repeat protein (TIGR01451 family)